MSIEALLKRDVNAHTEKKNNLTSIIVTGKQIGRAHV